MTRRRPGLDLVADTKGFAKSELGNRIRVISELHPVSMAVSIGVWVLTGTRHEPKGQEGLSHFLEHMVFKGTKKRTSFDIAKSLECLGGELNAYTTREYTCFHAYVLKDHWKVALDVLCDLVSNMEVDRADFELERSVILQEIAMAEDNLEELAYDIYFEHFLRDHPLGVPILGSENSIKNLSKKSVLDFYKGRYQGPGLIVAAAGPIDHYELVKATEKLLGKKTRMMKPDPAPSRRPPKHRDGGIVLERPAEQVHLLMGLPSASFNDKTRFEAFIVNAMLGGGMTSKLFQSIREKKGLAYSVFTSLNTFTDFGLLTVYAGTEAKKVKSVMITIRNELLKLKAKGVGPKELEFFKTQVRGSLLLGSDDIENRMSSIAVNEMVFGRYRPVNEIIDEVEAVTVESVDEFLQKYLRLEKMGRLLVGGGASEIEGWFQDFRMEG